MNQTYSRYLAQFFISLLFISFPFQGWAEEKLEATSKLLAGEWKLDFEKTWEVSEAAFLADTMRGADAYPDDPAKKAAIVKGEMEGVLKTVSLSYEDSGFLNLAMGGVSRGLKTEVTSSEGNALELACENGRAFRELKVEFETADEIRLTIVHAVRASSEASMVWVLTRTEE